MTKIDAFRYLIGGAIGSAVGMMVGATIMERKSRKILKSLETEMRDLAVDMLSKVEKQGQDTDKTAEWFTNAATGYSFKTTRRQILSTVNILNKSLLTGEQTRITMHELDCAFGKQLLKVRFRDLAYCPYFWDKNHLITVSYARGASRRNPDDEYTLVTFGNWLRVFDDI